MTSTYLSEAFAQSRLPDQAGYAVTPNQGVPNPILDERIRRKIEHLVTARGYRLAPKESADFFVTYSYAMEGVSGSGAEVVSGLPGYYVTGSNAQPVLTGGIGYTAVVSEPYTRFHAKLRLRVLEGEPLRRENKENVVWVGETFAQSASPDLRGLADYLLAAMFRFFGEDTLETKRIVLSRKDALARVSQASDGTTVAASTT